MRIFLILAIVTASIYSKPNVLEINSDTTMTTDLIIKDSEICKVKPGVKIYFAGYYRFIVKGLLIIDATADNPVLITAPDRNRGSVENPAWQGIEFYGEKNFSYLKHVRIEGSYRNLFVSAPVVLDSCEFVGNHYAIYSTSKSIVKINGCRIYRNKYGVLIDNGSPIIEMSAFYSNHIAIKSLLNSKAIIGKNIFYDNNSDLKDEKSIGESSNSVSVKYVWDLMNQMF